MRILLIVVVFFTSLFVYGCASTIDHTLLDDKSEELVNLLNKANDGDAISQYQLGLMYYQGNEIPQDLDQAIQWFEKATSQNLDIAQYTLGVFYEKGEDIPQDEKKAVELFTHAASQGMAEAQYKLGLRYLNGIGVGQDDVSAYAWLTLARQQGIAPSDDPLMFLSKRMTDKQMMQAKKLISDLKISHE